MAWPSLGLPVSPSVVRPWGRILAWIRTLDAALRRANYLYLTTYGASGKSSTVPVWCWYDGRDVYFTTHRESLKARRIRSTGRVTVRVGAKDGPAFEGRAELVDGRPDLEAALLRAYRRKYWLLVPLCMGRWIRRRLAAARASSSGSPRSGRPERALELGAALARDGRPDRRLATRRPGAVDRSAVRSLP